MGKIPWGSTAAKFPVNQVDLKYMKQWYAAQVRAESDYGAGEFLS